MNQSLTSQIQQTLTAQGVPFTVLQHEPTTTSEQSAAVRGEELGVGAKALLLRTDDRFRLFVLAADRRLDSAAVKKHLGLKKLRFATSEELFSLTGLVPGSVPPFGPPLLPFELFADVSVGATYPRVAFNAGSLTTSIIMSAADWETVARPERFRFSAD